MKKAHSILKDITVGALLLAVYFFAGKLGLSLAFVNESATAVWPPTGIALAALIILGYRFWPVILLGAFLVNLTTSGSWLPSVGISVGNTLEAVVGAYLVNSLAFGRQAFQKPSNILKYILFIGLACAISASIGVMSLYLGGSVAAEYVIDIWFTWWLGDMGGALVVAPFFIVWTAKKMRRLSRLEILEALILLSALVLVGLSVFGSLSFLGADNYPVAFVILPLLIWVAARFGRMESATVIFVFSAFAVFGTINGYGPFYTGNPHVSLLLLQAFICIVSPTTLALSSLIELRKELENNLLANNFTLNELKAKAEALFESLGEGAVATDEKGKIITINKTFHELLGYRSDEVIGKNTSEVMPMLDENGIQLHEKNRPLFLAFSSGQKVSARHFLLKKDGSKFFAAVTATPYVVNGKIIGAVKIFRDITVETEIDRAKSEFVSLASHQLRTPLTVIKWHAARLLEKWDKRDFTSAHKRRDVEEIYYTNQRMLELINAILNVSKIELGNLAVEPEEMDLVEIAEEVLEELVLQIQGKSINLHKDFEALLPKIKADPKLMRIVVLNLLTNSAKYTDSGGKISVKIKREGQNLLFEVQDSGCGIPKKDYDKIFTKFYRTDAARKIDPEGNGLGMYIVKAIVDRAEGKIGFKSEEGKGTTFYVILPIEGTKKKEGAKGLIESYA